MYQEAIEKYLKQHGHSNIDLKAVLFDMDGVLFNSMPNHASSWHKVMKRMGFGLSEEEAYMHEGRTGADTINIISRRISHAFWISSKNLYSKGAFFLRK